MRLTGIPEDPVFCVGCNEQIAVFNDSGLADRMGAHTESCDAHSMDRCEHKGPCWTRERPTEHAKGAVR